MQCKGQKSWLVIGCLAVALGVVFMFSRSAGAQEIEQINPDAVEAEREELTASRCATLESKGLLIKQWDLDELEADLTWCGRNGSPTKVHRIQSVVLAAKESKDVEPTEEGITDMIHELIQDKIIA